MCQAHAFEYDRFGYVLKRNLSKLGWASPRTRFSERAASHGRLDSISNTSSPTAGKGFSRQKSADTWANGDCNNDVRTVSSWEADGRRNSIGSRTSGRSLIRSAEVDHYHAAASLLSAVDGMLIVPAKEDSYKIFLWLDEEHVEVLSQPRADSAILDWLATLDSRYCADMASSSKEYSSDVADNDSYSSI